MHGKRYVLNHSPIELAKQVAHLRQSTNKEPRMMKILEHILVQITDRNTSKVIDAVGKDKKKRNKKASCFQRRDAHPSSYL